MSVVSRKRARVEVSSSVAACSSAQVGLSPVRNFLSVASAEGVAKIIGFVGTLYVIRTVDKSTFGVAALALAAAAYADAAILRGMDMQVVRELSPWPEQPGSLLRRLLLIRAVLGVLAAGFVVSVTIVAVRGAETELAMFAAAGIVAIRGLQTRAIYQARQNQRIVAAGRVTSACIALVTVLVFVRSTSSPLPIVASVLMGEAFFTLWLLVPLLGLLFGGRGSSERPRVHRLVSVGLRLSVGFLLVQGLATLDLLLVGAWRGTAEAGVYSAAYRVSDGLYLVPSALGAAFLPRVAAARSGRHGGVGVALLAYWRIAALFALPTVIVGPLLAPWFVRVLFGDAYVSSAPALAGLMVALGFAFVSAVFLYSLGMTQRDGRFVAVLALGLAVNLAANIIAIPRWGATGAGWSMALSEAFIAALATFSMRTEVDLRLVRTVASVPASIAGAAGVAVLGARLVGAPWAIVVAAAVVPFLVLAFWRRRDLMASVREAASV